jgi:hypothetical protein
VRLLLSFFLGIFVVGVLTAQRPNLTPRTAGLLGLCTVVSLGYLARRFL